MAVSAILASQWAAMAADESGNETNRLDAGNIAVFNHLGNPCKGQVEQETYLAEDVSGFLPQNTQGIGRATKLAAGPGCVAAKRVAVKVELIEWDGATYTTLDTSALVNSGDVNAIAQAETEDVAWGETCTARFAKTTAQERWNDNRLSTTVRSGPFILNPNCFFGGSSAVEKKLLNSNKKS